MLKGKCISCNKQKFQFISIADAKKGGFIFTVPSLATSLEAAGSLAGGIAGIAKAVQKSEAANKLLEKLRDIIKR